MKSKTQKHAELIELHTARIIEARLLGINVSLLREVTRRTVHHLETLISRKRRGL